MTAASRPVFDHIGPPPAQGPRKNRRHSDPCAPFPRRGRESSRQADALTGGFQPPRTNQGWSITDRFHCRLPWLDSVDKNAVIVRNSLVNPHSSLTRQDSGGKAIVRIRLFESIRSVYRFLSAPLALMERTISGHCWRKRRFRFPVDVFILRFLRLRLDALSSWLRNILKRLLLKRKSL